MAKNIRGSLENLFECCFLNIIVNVNFFTDLKSEYIVSTILKLCYKKALNKKLKLIGGTMKFFRKHYWVMKYLFLWSPRLRIFFWRICKTFQPPSRPSYILNVRSLRQIHSFVMNQFLSLVASMISGNIYLRKEFLLKQPILSPILMYFSCHIGWFNITLWKVLGTTQ